MSNDLKDKTPAELEQLVIGLGGKKYLAGYLFKFIHVLGVTQIDAISPLSRAFRAQLSEQGGFISALSLDRKLRDADGTMKYVFRTADEQIIETVLLTDRLRKTLCVSTQLGCAMGCTFCATANVTFKRNLTAAEIVDQVISVERDAGRINNVVYMGMGEPLLNYEAVLKSIAILNHPQGKNIGIRHLTISTCGIIPGIEALAQASLCPRLAVSLNAPTNALRRELMPISAKYPLAELIKTIGQYQKEVGQRVTFEYVMFRDINDRSEQARLLVKLLAPLHVHVNLIELNPHPGCRFRGSDSKTIERFAAILEAAGIETTIRLRMGRQISAACGQLGADRYRKQDAQ